MSEQDITRAILDALNASGRVEVWRTHSGKVKLRGGWMYLAPKGTPDITGFTRDGRFIGVEVKKPDGKTDKERAELQAAARERIQQAGGIAFEARSVAEAIGNLLRAVARQ